MMLPALLPEFTSRGRTSGWNNRLQRLLDSSVLGLIIHPGCDRVDGIVSRIEARPVNPLWRPAYEQARRDGEEAARLPVDPRLKTTIHVIWLMETPDEPAGYVVPYLLHATQVGDRVRIHVRPDDGRITGLANRDRPRRTWQY